MPAVADKRLAGAAPLRAGRRGAFIGRAVLAALVPSLAGCAVGPDFAPPAAPVADQYLEAHNRSIVTGKQDYRDWWKVFHDPVLDRLVEIAYNQNLTLF